MTAREYLEKNRKACDVTFVIQKAEKDTGSPFYNNVYSVTPIRAAYEWLKDFTWPEKYIVINADHPPIDPTGSWLRMYKKGHLLCAMITTEEELIRHYGEKQGRELIQYYNENVKL